MRTHHRNYAYRPPPRRKSEGGEGGWDLLRRFAAVYLTPFKWPIIGCMVLVALNGCSFYLMTYYTRMVVDDVLVVESGSHEELFARHGAYRRMFDAYSSGASGRTE
jgi:hypothetical protein